LIVAAMAAGLGVGAVNAADTDTTAPSAHSDSIGAAIADTAITAKLKSELLLADSVSKGIDVSVETTHGVVVLTGVLASESDIDHIKKMAKQVSGVKSVDTTGLTVAARS
jgi:hyperosmotically inducible protein